VGQGLLRGASHKLHEIGNKRVMAGQKIAPMSVPQRGDWA
jgi:hypothetical protein